MATKKLSQIPAAPNPPSLTDALVGVGGGATDLLYSVSQLRTSVGGVTASQVSNIPFGIISSTNVQGALNQLEIAIPSPGPGTDPLALVNGLSLMVSQPVLGGIDNGVSFRFDSNYDVTTAVEPGFTNMLGQYQTMETYNADVTFSHNVLGAGTGIDAKSTFSPLWIDHTCFAGAQRFVEVQKIHAFGMGDASFVSQLGEFANGPLPGDEGIGFTEKNAFNQITPAESGTIIAPSRAAGNTTTTQAIAAILAPQTITVVSAVNINVGEWYCIEQMRPDAIYNTEAIQILAVDHILNTITARFRINHLSGVTVTPSLVINNYTTFLTSPGQLRVLVNLSGATYNTGTVVNSFGGGALTGSGTTWTTGIVGGNANNIGAISLDRDTLAVNGMRSWYEIRTVDSVTQLEIVSFSVAADTSYRSTRGSFPSTYVIHPAVRILHIDPVGQKLICETTTTVWNAGDTVECAICPYPDITGFSYTMSVNTPGATFRGMMSLSTEGAIACSTGLGISGVFGGTGTDLGYSFGVGVSASQCLIGLAIGTANVTGAATMQITGNNGKTPIQWLNQNVAIDGNAFDGMRIGTIPPDNSNYFETFGPGLSINTDANLAMMNMPTHWLKLTGIVNIQRSYMFLDDTQITSDVSAVDDKFGSFALSLHGNIVDATTRFSSAHSHGMGTNGVLETARTDVTLANGANGVITLAAPSSFLRIVGPTAAFSIDGIVQAFTNWSASHNLPAGDGTFLTIYNSVAFPMTINNNNSGDNSGFLTLTGANVTLRSGPSCATFKYVGNGGDQRWILIATN